MRKILLGLSVLIFLICYSPPKSWAKEYSIPVIRIEVDIQADGSVRITEHRTYIFDDDFSWADYKLPFRGFTALNNITVTENGRKYINENNEKPGTFLVSRDDDEFQIKWFFEAENEQRTFSISYTLQNTIVTGAEWAEFFWNYISADREKDTDTLQIEMVLPEAVGMDSLFVWKRGASAKTKIQQTTQGFVVTAKNIGDDESIEIRSVFPTSILSENAETINNDTFSLAWALQDEQTYQREQERIKKENARYAGFGQKLLIIVSLLSITAFWFFYNKFGKRYSQGGPSGGESLLIPGRQKPAVIGWLIMERNIGNAQLMATLLDLARRRFFIIKEQEPKKKMLGGEKKTFTIQKTSTTPQDALSDWEADLAEYIGEQIENGNNRIDKMFSSNSYKTAKWFSTWKKKVIDHCKTLAWYDQKSYTGAYLNAAAQFVLLAGAILGAIWAGPIGIVGIGIITIFLIGSVVIIRRTPEGEQTYRRWQNYRKGLKNAEDHYVDRDLLDRHFIYAITFGLSKDNIETVFTQCDASTVVFYWFIFHGNAQHSVSEIAGTFSTLGATGAASFAGVAGGAGATAGVAGGGASGGAG